MFLFFDLMHMPLNLYTTLCSVVQLPEMVFLSIVFSGSILRNFFKKSSLIINNIIYLSNKNYFVISIFSVLGIVMTCSIVFTNIMCYFSDLFLRNACVTNFLTTQGPELMRRILFIKIKFDYIFQRNLH